MNITEVIVVKPALINFTKVTKRNSNSLPISHHKSSDITIKSRGGGGGVQIWKNNRIMHVNLGAVFASIDKNF